MMNKGRKIMAALLLGGMLCGSAVTADAAVKAEHVHAYSYDHTVTLSATPGTSHPYVTGTITDSSGNVTYLYGTCQTVNYRYRDYYKCGCGSVYSLDRGDEWHSACGK